MSLKQIQLQPFALAGAGAIIGDTSIVLKSMLSIDGSALSMATNFGTIGYGTIDPGNNTLEEQISFTGLTNNANGTTTLTGVSSITFSDPYTSTSGLLKTHAGSVSLVISNTSGYYSVFPKKDNNEVITGFWTVPDPVSSLGIANQEYVLAHVNGGAVSIDTVVVAGTAGENLTVKQPVYLKNDGLWYKASSATAGTCLSVQLGICQTTANTGVATTVLLSGMDKTQSGLSTGSTYYLQDTAGTIGTSAGTISVDLGEAISATNLQFNPRFVSTFVTSTVSAASTSTTGAINKVPIGLSSGAPNLDLTWLPATTGTTDQSQATQNSSITVGEQNLTTKHYLVAQSFVPTRQSISAVTLSKVADTGTFTGTVKVSLQVNSAGSPSGSDLASYTISNAVWLKLNATANFTIAFGTEYESLTVGSLYWIVVTPSTTDNANHPNLGINTAGGYAAGTLKFNNTTDGWVTVATSKATFATVDGVLNKIPVTSTTSGLLPANVLPYSFVSVDKTTATVSNTAVETTVFSKQMAAGFFTANSGIRVRIFGTLVAGNGTVDSTNIAIKYNGTTFGTVSTPATSATGWIAFSFLMDFTVINNNSLSSQIVIGYPLNQPKSQGAGTITAATLATQFGALGTAFGTSSINLADPGLFEITATNSSNNAGTTTTYLGSIIEKIG